MQEVTTKEKTFVYANGVINVYQDDDGWHYIANSDSKTTRSTDTYINWHCARANAYLAMQSEYGIELKGVK